MSKEIADVLRAAREKIAVLQAGADNFQIAAAHYTRLGDHVMAESSRRRANLLQLEIADLEVARIMAMSDAEVIAETIAQGLDLAVVAEECRAAFRRAIAEQERAP